MAISTSAICVLILALILIPYLQYRAYLWIGRKVDDTLDHISPTKEPEQTMKPKQQPNNQPTRSIETQVNKLKRIAYSNPEKSQPFMDAWQQILDIQPTNLEAHVMLGWSIILTPNNNQEYGIQLLEQSFDPQFVNPTIDLSFPQAYLIAATIGRYRAQKKEYTNAKKFTELALQLSSKHTSTTQSEVSCILVQLASMFDYFPASEEDQDRAIASIEKYSDRILTGWDNEYWPIKDGDLMKFPGAAPDPFAHCVLSLFSLSFYYRSDVAVIANSPYQMSKKGWPSLSYTADFVKEYDVVKDSRGEHPCINRKIRLAVISGVLTEGHSNSESFGGMLSQLDRNIFEVTYLLLVEPTYAHQQIAEFTKTHPQDKVYSWSKNDHLDAANGGAWPLRWGEDIAKWELDIILYPDLTMSNLARRLGMMRLAPVQVNTNGHPVTSGHDRSVIQYFIAWEAAELPLEEAQTHYTEELKLIPSNCVYQYYKRRIVPGSQMSRMDFQQFGHLTRSDFDLPHNKNIYLSMQKPFKITTEFDKLACGIIKKDQDAILVLLRSDSQANQNVFKERLARAGCHMSRVKFLDQQPHHRLLALYKEATVILDSYPAGGDTTTREVIEMGKAVVTWPARLLGGRWTVGYLNSIGLKEATKKALIASNAEEYISLAVTLANDDNLRKYVEADILASSSYLFEQQNAVDEWQKMLLEISPYQQCTQSGNKDEL